MNLLLANLLLANLLSAAVATTFGVLALWVLTDARPVPLLIGAVVGCGVNAALLARTRRRRSREEPTPGANATRR